VKCLIFPLLSDVVGLQSDSGFITVQNIACLSFGAVLGAALRLTLINYFRKLISPVYWSTTLVNLIACFFFGIALAWAPKYSSSYFFEQINFFFNVGFLGSLSTFSTYVVEIIDNLQKQDIRQLLLLLTAPIICSMFIVALGYAIGNV